MELDGEAAPEVWDTMRWVVSDPSQLKFLEMRLRDLPHVEARRESLEPGAGELGGSDYLAVVASSTGLIAAIKILPSFLRARRSDIKITCTIRDQPVVLEISNIDDVLPVLEQMLRD
jgi:hypothetical protein